MAAINTSSNNAIYLEFRGVGATPELIVPASALYAVVLVGILMNSFVVYVTARNGNLRGSANFLVAMACLFEVVHQTGHTFFFVVVASGTNFVSLLTADLFLSPMLFAVNANMMAMFCAAADRLFAVAFPLHHKRICLEHKRRYLALMTLICVCFGLYSLYYILAFGLQNPGIPTTGCVSEVLSGPVGLEFFAWTGAWNSGCVLCYALIFALIRCKNGVSKETNTRLLRSLVIILCITVGGYLINLSVYQLLFTFGDKLGSPVRVWQFGFIAGVLLNAGAAANAPILYLNSTEYRKVFRQELLRLTNGSSVGTFQQVHPSQHNHASRLNRMGGAQIGSTGAQQSIQLNRF